VGTTGSYQFALPAYFTLPAGADGYYVKLSGTQANTGTATNRVYIKELSEVAL